MNRRLAVGIIGLSLAVAVPVSASAAKPENPLVQQAASESLANPAVREAVRDGRVAPTSKTARYWHKKQMLRRQQQERAEAKRRQMMSGSGGDQPPQAP